MCGINRNDTEVCRSMTKKLRRAEGGSPDIDTAEDIQIHVSSTFSYNHNYILQCTYFLKL